MTKQKQARTYKYIRVPEDRLYFDLVPRSHPHAIPSAGIFDTPHACLNVNLEWASHIMGMIASLLEPDAWIGDDAAVDGAQQQVMSLMASLATICTAGGTDMQFRQTDCLLEGSTDNGETWFTVFDSTLCAIPGPPGPPGPPGEPGEPGEDCECEPVNPEPEEPIEAEDPRGDYCGIAVYLVDWLYLTTDDYLSQLDAGLTVSEIVQEALGATGGGDIIVDNIIGLLTQIVALSTAVIRSELDTATLDALKCALYCEIKRAGGFSRSLFPAAEQRWIDDNSPGLQKRVVVNLFWSGINAFTENAVNARARIGALTPSAFCENACGTCDEVSNVGQWDWRYGESWGNWDISSVPSSQYIGVQVDGVGWEDSYDGDDGTPGGVRGVRGIAIERQWVTISALSLKRFTVVGRFEEGEIGAGVVTLSGGTSSFSQWQVEIPFSELTSEFTHEFETPVSIQRLRFTAIASADDTYEFPQQPDDRGGSALLQRLKIVCTTNIPAGHFSVNDAPSWEYLAPEPVT